MPTVDHSRHVATLAAHVPTIAADLTRIPSHFTPCQLHVARFAMHAARGGTDRCRILRRDSMTSIALRGAQLCGLAREVARVATTFDGGLTQIALLAMQLTHFTPHGRLCVECNDRCRDEREAKSDK